MKLKYLGLTAIVLVFTLSFSRILLPASAAVIDMNLGSAATFGLLAKTMTTVETSVSGNTGAITQTVIPHITNGKNYLDDSVYHAADIDLGNAIGYANSQVPTVNGTAGADLGGEILLPGIYNYPGAVNISADVTLSGDDIFIFQIAGTLDTTAGTKILLTDGAQACNIYWVVNGAATLAANTEFNGSLLSQSSATTVGINTIINGRILSQDAVTFTGPGPSNITVPACVQEPPVEPPVQPPVETDAPAPIPDTATPIPATATPVPVTETSVPVTATPVPATVVPIPATAIPIPATATPVPATATPIPATATPIPATATPIPATVTPIPATVTLIPATATPIPAAATPGPAASPVNTPAASPPAELPAAPAWSVETEWVKVGLLPDGDMIIDAKLPDNQEDTGVWNFDLGGKLYNTEGTESVNYRIAKAPVGTYNILVRFTSHNGTVFKFEVVPVSVPTVTGGQLPATATPWYNLLLSGSLLTIMGGVILWRRKLRE
ncbi:ice-binding family protein [Paenibacillus sp. FSL R5-0912]|uniref:ice-binding family protein n=1 Tax=Paenibacillus sp. FSL R5-0912 TaxID=1536771 RepID=UPI000A985EBB|nr:ice-binding family protein [Paenibacillus sp. FSL R5-0912]